MVLHAERRQVAVSQAFDGVVVEMTLSPGEFLDQDGQLATIAQLDPLYVEAFLPVSDFGKFQVGARAEVTPDEPISGTYVGLVTVIDQVFDAW